MTTIKIIESLADVKSNLISKLLSPELLEEIRLIETEVTSGPWYPPHLSDPDSVCQCRSIVEEGYCGGIATVHIDNGKLVGDGGNDGPPLKEARANA
jgi:hypothetical protein